VVSTPDRARRSSIYETATWTSNVHIFRDDVPQPLEVRPGLTIWGAAHKAPRNTDNFFQHFRVDRAGLNIGLFHASERSSIHLQGEGKQPHAPFLADEILASGLDHVLLGHYHNPVDEKNYAYPGNPEPLTFGESGERGPVILEVDHNGSITRQRIRVSQIPLQNVEIDVSNSSDTQAILEAISAKLSDKRGIAQVRLFGDVDKSVSLDRGVLETRKGALDYARWQLDGLRPAYDLAAIYVEHTVRGQFARDVRDANFSDEDERRRVLITGLRALDGRSDLEIV
jgi:exonuclease SbcD